MSVLKLTPDSVSHTVQQVLDNAADEFSDVLVIGWDKKDGTFKVAASKDLTCADCNWLIDLMKKQLMHNEE